MHNLIVVLLYAFVTLATFVISVLNSALGEEVSADFDPSAFSAIDIAILTEGTGFAADIMIVDLLCAGSAWLVVHETRWTSQYFIELDEPQSRVLTRSVKLTKGRYRRERILASLATDISARREVLIENGFIRSLRDVTRTIAWTSYPLAASTGLGLFLLSLFPDGSWPRVTITICFVCGCAALRLVNVDVGRAPSGNAALKAVRSLYSNHLTPSLTYAVALWGLERLRSTPFEAYAKMAQAEKAD